MSKLSQLVVLAVLLAIAVSASGQNIPLSVCRTLDATGDHDRVVVRGDVVATGHGIFLMEQAGKYDPCPGWPRRVFTSPPMVGLEFRSSHGVRLTGAEEKLDMELLKRFRTRGRHYRVTLSGIFVREPLPLIFRDSSGTYSGFGMGPYGDLLAALVITNMIEEGQK